MGSIHNPASFKRDSIAKRATKHGFANPWAVELFLWDLEIASQLQNTSEELVLKGGTATQLFLPVEFQRGSRDVDMLAPMPRQELEEILRKTEQRLDGPRFVPFVPKNPIQNLPLATYLVPIASNFHAGGSTVKVDFLLETSNLPSVELKDRETFAVKTVGIRCLRPEVLVGEKTLTLAHESIGIQDYADLPKHVYDVSMLLDSGDFRGLADVAKSVELIAPVEAKIHGKDVDAVKALRHVKRFIEDELGLIDTTFARRETKRSFEAFDDFYAPSSQRGTFEEWSARALKIGFLAELIESVLAGNLKLTAADAILKNARNRAIALRRLKGTEAAKVRLELLSKMKKRKPYFKELRGKTLHRVFWQVATPDNLDDLPAYT